MGRTILHIDMDAFFAAIEVLDNPTLSGKPVIVGGSTNRGVVSTANYEARKFGVHSAMPIFMAKKKCPHGVFRRARKWRYAEVSRKILYILNDFTPLVEQVSIDEAYLDITGTEGLFGSPEEVARRIKARIRDETGLTCSIGIAPSKLLAKIGSDMNKPDGLTEISRHEAGEFLSGLPIDKIPGVGKRSLAKLQQYGIKQVRDLLRFGEEGLSREFGKFRQRLYDLARGEGSSPVVPTRDAKSISSEETLESDTGDLAFLMTRIGAHADRVGRRLRRERLKGATITIKIKYTDFSSTSKSQTLPKPTDSSRAIAEAAIALLMDYPLKGKVRLLGVAVSNLRRSLRRTQLGLFGEGLAQVKEQKVDEAMDTIRDRYGTRVIRRGED